MSFYTASNDDPLMTYWRHPEDATHEHDVDAAEGGSDAPPPGAVLAQHLAELDKDN